MPGIMKQAKLKAIMDIISQMDDLEMDRMMPKKWNKKRCTTWKKNQSRKASRL